LKKILVLGAGRSSIYLIEYLLDAATKHEWEVTIADLQLAAAVQKAAGHKHARPVALDLRSEAQLQTEVARANVVVSLLPADMHLPVAHACVKFQKSMFTASYVSPGMQALDGAARSAELLFLNEMGCDPGIDHMSTMELIDEIRSRGGIIKALYSYTGGLVSRESDTHPWHYKFSWNPRNVVLAGQPGPARYLANNYIRYKPYNRIFRETERVEVPGFGELDAYANRDSLPYKKYYGLEHAHTILRATFRYPDYCQGWSIFVFLGLTNDDLSLENCDQITYRDFLNMFLPPDDTTTVRAGFEKTLRERLNFSPDQVVIAMAQFDYLEFFSDRTFKKKQATPASLLLEILEDKWQLASSDRDLIVMHHRLLYELEGKELEKTSTLVLEGHDDYRTAMAKTVGLPLAIAVKLYLTGGLQLSGVHIPTLPDIYEPVLAELEAHGIRFH
jgi:saccharopine dehydrogenase-like NADP-dependent oxidoreductase